MAQQDRTGTRLSDISHLFLSSVRDRQTQGASRPVRKPPTARPSVSIDLTPEEFAQVLAGDTAVPHAVTEIAPVQAVIGPHLGADQMQRVRQLARHMAADGSRVGVVTIDVCEFQLLCFDRQAPLPSPLMDPLSSEYFEPGDLGDAMEELNVDIDQWLLVVLNPRLPEARSVLRCADHWTFLSTCDHDTIVACYRTLKGLSGLHDAEWALAVLDWPSEADAFRVYSKLAGCCRQFLGATLENHTPVKPNDEVSEHTVFSWRSTHDKATVSTGAHWQVVTEFFRRARNIDIDSELDSHESIARQAEEQPMNNGHETQVPAIDQPCVTKSTQPPTAQIPAKRTYIEATTAIGHPAASGPVQAEVAPATFTASAPPTSNQPAARPAPANNAAKIAVGPVQVATATEQPVNVSIATDAEAAHLGTVGEVIVQTPDAETAATHATPGPRPVAMGSEKKVVIASSSTDSIPMPGNSTRHHAEELPDMDVIDLPSNITNPQTILSAVLEHAGSSLVECPVKPPMCPEARLAVTREHRLTLLAVAGDGLSDLRSIGQAYRWLNENRSLVAMAVPQLSIDAHQLPHLRLLVSRADLAAEILQPMLQSSSVTVESYRKLRWGAKSGLVLEAA